jgi:hypothetical protein
VNGPSDPPAAPSDALPEDGVGEPVAPRSRRLLLVFAAIVGLVIVALVATSTGVLTLGRRSDMPPPGAIWFGTTYDPSSLVLEDAWTTSPQGRPVSVVAHLSRPSTPGLAVTMTLDGSKVVDTTIDVGSGHGYVAFPPGPVLGRVAGSWVVTIADARGVVAQGTLTVTP